MSNNAQFDGLTRSTVYDRVGEKVGKVEQLYISDTNDLPTWVSVKTGFFGTSHSLVPLANATHRDDRIDVAYTKEQIKNAPHLDTDAGTTSAQDDELLRHYGLTGATAGWEGYGKHAAAPDAAAGRNPAESKKDLHSASTDGAASVVRSEERLNVGKETVQTGKARLRKYVVTEQQTINVPVTREEVRVVREPLDANSHTGKASIGEDAAEVILHEERVRVSKETVPVERVGLAVDQVTEDRTVTEDVRKEHIDTDGIETADRPKQPKRS